MVKMVHASNVQWHGGIMNGNQPQYPVKTFETSEIDFNSS
jgi:hypothetical protein